MSDDHHLKEQLRQMPEVPSAEIWDMVRQQTGMDTRQLAPVRHRIRKPLMAAAAVIILLLIGIGTHQVPTVAQRLIVDSNGSTAPLTFQLPDGTKVTLCYGSRISYKDARDIDLSGQAEFNVAQDAAKPFIVHCGQTITRVLGTDFNVMAWPDVPAEITLLSGKVEVTQGGITRLLKPSQQVIVNKDDMPVKTLKEPGETIGWEQKAAYIGFDTTKLTTVMRHFARWYHVIISNPYNVKGGGIKGHFKLQDPLDSNLTPIKDAERQIVRVEHRNDTIFLLPWR